MSAASVDLELPVRHLRADRQLVLRALQWPLRNGVGRAHLLDGRIPHALLLECFTRQGVGTMVVP